jgi:hypothetical protein
MTTRRVHRHIHGKFQLHRKAKGDAFGLSALNFDFVVVGLGKEMLLVETDANTGVAGYMQQ